MIPYSGGTAVISFEGLKLEVILQGGLCPPGGTAVISFEGLKHNVIEGKCPKLDFGGTAVISFEGLKPVLPGRALLNS